MKKKFAQRLKELRVENEMSQTALAKKIKISQQTVAAWEQRGIKPSVDKLIVLAKTLNTSVDYLLGLTDKKGVVMSVDEIKKRFPELSDKLDLLGVDYLNWEADMSEEQLIKIAHKTLDRAIKKMEKQYLLK